MAPLDSSRLLRFCLLTAALAVIAYAAVYGIVVDDLPWNRKVLGASGAALVAILLTVGAVRLWREWVER